MRPSTGKVLRLETPAGFRFRRCVEAHGWFDLPPFRWDPDRGTLARGLVTRSGTVVGVMIRADAARTIAVEILGGRAGRGTETDVSRLVRRMLRLDEDLGSFYAHTRRATRPDLGWAAEAGAGRLLRAPTVYEDLVKLICTTNCSWSLTRSMVRQLVERLGAPAPGGLRAFPTPVAMAGATERFYTEAVRAGYRASSLRALARAVTSGALDTASWDDPGLSTEAIREAVLGVRGAGPYVADNLLRLLGRYEGLGLDSWCRSRFSDLHRDGRKTTDRAIARFYAPFGPWRGLALWCDLTRDWFDPNDPLSGRGPASAEKFPPA